MLFNSYGFLFVFLPVTLCGFFFIAAKGSRGMAIGWLVVTSLCFYAWWNPAYLALLGISILFNFATGNTLSGLYGGDGRWSRWLLRWGVAVNLALIAYFKYANFFVDTARSLFGVPWQLEEVVLPLAISFFTFQQITYLVDSYRGETREYNFLDYCLFVTFFPQLIAGPIVHHKEMMPQFARGGRYRLDPLDLAVGVTMFSIGLFKKVVIADSLAPFASQVFWGAEHGVALDVLTAWRGTFCYTLQLYFDFSGYSDMALGLARMFGIKLPLNFFSPYQATNIIDFWRRWHMTLSRFLRDYLYIPLGGNRKGRMRRYLNLFLTMLLGGLWHGAGWTFVFWGGLHGLYLIINHAWHRLRSREIGGWWSRAGARALTFLAVTVGWVFFRAETFDGARAVLRGMVNLPSTFRGRIGALEGLLSSLGFQFDGGCITYDHYTGLAWLVGWLAVLWLWPNTQQWMERFEPALKYEQTARLESPARRFLFARWRPTAAWAVVIVAVAISAVLHLAEISEFLYFQF